MASVGNNEKVPFIGQLENSCFLPVCIVQRCGMWKQKTLLKEIWGNKRKFPGSSVLRSQCFHCHDLGSIPVRELMSCKLQSVVGKKRKRTWSVSELIMNLKSNNNSIISNTLGSFFWVCISEAKWEHHGIQNQCKIQGRKLR